MKYQVCLLGWLILFFSCERKSKHGLLDDVFAKWETKTQVDKVEMFRNSVIDSTANALLVIGPTLDSIMSDVMKSDDLVYYLDSTYHLRAETKKACVGLLFYSYLHGNSLSDSEIVAIIRKNDLYNSTQNMISNTAMNEKIAKDNYQAIDVGDSIDLIFPVIIEFNKRHTIFYSGYPYSYDYSSADDSLLIKAVLENKSYGVTRDNKIDTCCLSFNIRIIELSDTSTKILGSKLYVGDKFNFCLQDYGRVINQLR